FNAMRELVNADIFADYWRIFNVLGTAGTNPFAATQLAQAANIQLQFDTQKARGPRRVILDGPARTNALSTADFVNADKRGSANSINTGALGTVFGVDYYYDQQVPRHVSTPLTAGNATVNGAHSAGAKTISIAKATNAAPLVKGDIITFAGDTQTYSVQANVTLAVGNTNVTIEPGLAVAKSGSELMTLTASHRVNLAFTRPAIAFANREAGDVALLRQAGANVISQVDPVTGVVYSLEIKREHYQVAWHLSALWGKRVIKPEWCFRLMGA
ncbi:MAG: hypothetical protein KF805_08460, partial [Phycisphaeraceae bacterium]|nr:hypothetical protein [Phycisphaeraceae bacterium]